MNFGRTTPYAYEHDSKEAYVISDLLSEYSAKLIAISEQLENTKWWIGFLIYCMCSFLPLFIVVMWRLFIWEGYIEGYIGGVLVYPPLAYLVWINIKRRKALIDDKKILSIKLEGIRQSASNMIKQADPDSVTRLHLISHLEDVERVLRHVSRS